MNGGIVWAMAWLPLRNSLSRLFFRQRGDGTSEVRAIVIAALSVWIVSEYVLAFSAGAVLRHSIQARGLPAMAWSTVALSGVVFGIAAVMASQIETLKRMDEPFSVLPVRRFDIACSQVLSLALEGLGWMYLLVFPFVVLALASAVAGAVTQAVATVAATALFLTSWALGAIIAHLFLLLTPGLDRGRGLAGFSMALIIGGGAGTVAVVARGGSWSVVPRFAGEIADTRWLPVWLAKTATQVPADAVSAAWSLLLLTMTSFGLLFAATILARANCDPN